MTFDIRNPKWFYSIDEVPELTILEENYSVILSELTELINSPGNKQWAEIFPKYVDESSENKWKLFTFQFFGIKHPLNCKACPNTYNILKKIPDLITAEFSYLPANTHILPHKGFSKMVLRAHLGLIIPKHCSLRVGDETREWEKAKMLIFDDSFEHEAWNNSNEDRYVLMLDIANPKWGYTSKEICKYKIETLQDEVMLSLFPKEKWIEYLEKGEFNII